MEKIIDRLQSKWGCFEKDNHYLKQMDTSNGKKKAYLNILFNPIAQSEFVFAKIILNCDLHPNLLHFYEQFNGIMLFSESLRIYGIETNSNALYDSYDIVAQNEDDDIQGYGEQYANFVVFGYYSSCLFCFDKTNFDFLYVL